MSGIVKGIKKVFKKVVKFVKRYWKEIIIAAAIIFTAGAAAGAWGAAAAGGAAGGGAAGAAAGVGAAGTAAGAGAGAAAVGGTAGAIGAGATVAGGGAALAGSTVFSASGAAAALGTGAAAGGAVTAGGLAAGGAFAAGSGLAAAGGSAAAGGALAAGGAAAGGAASGGAITTLAPVVVTGTATAAPSLASTVGAAAISSGGVAAFSQAAVEVSPKKAEVQQTEQEGVEQSDVQDPNLNADGTPKNFLQKTAAKGKQMWDGLSSFEKVQLMATSVNMLSAATRKPEDQTQEFPMQQQFYGHEQDGSGAGIGFDYNPDTGRMVPGVQGPGGEGVAAGQSAGQASFQPMESNARRQDTRSASPMYKPRRATAPGQASFVDAASESDDSRLPKSFIEGDQESLQRRMDFVAGGYKSGDFIGGGS